MRGLKFLFVLIPVALAGQTTVRRMTLEQAVTSALENNSYLKMARVKVREHEKRTAAARTDFFPQLTTDANYMHLAEAQHIEIPRGAFGVFKDIGPVPISSLALIQGANQFFYSTTTLAQPLTQMIKIRQGHQIARLETGIAASDLRKAENEVAVRVHEAFFGLLIAQRQKKAAELEVTATEEKLREARKAVDSGNTLPVTATGARAALLAARHAKLSLENQISDISVEFNDLVGLPLETDLELVPPDPPAASTLTREECLKTALESSEDIRAAAQTVSKARRAVTAARADFIPEIGAYGQYLYQNGAPFVAKNNGIFGVKMTWKVFDFGKRNDVIGERRALLEQAEENLRRLKNRTTVEVEKSYRKLQRSKEMIEVATEALELRRESGRLSGEQVKAGVTVMSSQMSSEAALAKAEADLLAANLGYRLAEAELQRAMGHTPR
ncbi:MAG: TolC family protein [Bryobacteraceae bacterium]